MKTLITLIVAAMLCAALPAHAVKRALIETASNRIAQVVPVGKDFPVAPGLQWRDCADDVTPETHLFNGTAFVAKPAPPQPTPDEAAASTVDRIDRLQFEVLFDMENRMRAREGLGAVTRAQYRTALINRWKALNS